MVEYNKITVSKQREPIYPEKRVWLPALTRSIVGSAEYSQWMKDNWWMVDYKVHFRQKRRAEALAWELDKMFGTDEHDPRIPKIVKVLKRLRPPDASDRTPLQEWTHYGYQLVDYCCGQEIHQTLLKRLGSYRGKILEAMCGHQSYFSRSKHQDVTAIDFCKVSLERYPFPERQRIECNLDQISRTTHLPFPKESFDVVSICFGFRYPRNIGNFLQGLRHVLKQGGIISFIENPAHGYEHIVRRTSHSSLIESALRRQGFKQVQSERLDIKKSAQFKDDDVFHHTQGLK